MTYELTTPSDLTAVLAGLRIRSRDIVIVGIGDSHFNGQLQYASATDNAADTVFQMPVPSPLDKVWSSSNAESSFWRIDSQINSKTGNGDPNTAVGTLRGSLLAYIPSSLRGAYASLRKITTANLGVGGSSWWSWNGESAFGWLKGVANATDGDTVSLDGVTYTFRTAVSAAYDVLIGGSVNATMTNLVNAMHLEVGTPGTTWGTGTALHPTCWCPTIAQLPNLKIMAVVEGTGGNGKVVASSNTLRISAANTSLVVQSSVTMASGANVSALYTNGKAAISNIGSVDVVLVSLGTNDANIAGYRGRNTSASAGAFLDQIHADFPTAMVIVSGGPPTTASPTNGYLATINTALKTVVSARSSWCSYVDFLSLGASTGMVTLINAASPIHCTNYGYQIWASLYALAVGTALALI